MTAREQYAEVLAAVLADHVMSGEPECLSPSMVWVWRCVCRPEYAHAASVRSAALTSHRAHVADALAAALPDPEQAVREAWDEGWCAGVSRFTQRDLAPSDNPYKDDLVAKVDAAARAAIGEPRIIREARP